jgi:predicted DNA-binding protein YlxM (UPF0122 family)
VKEVMRKAHLLVEQKLTGSARQEAKQWLHQRANVMTEKKVQAFIDRLECLPDSGAAHSNTIFSAEQCERIRGAYANGVPLEEIAKRFHISQKSVSRFVKDLPRRKNSVSEEQRAEIRGMYLRNFKVQQIAESTGVSPATVYRIVKGLQ